MTDTANIPASTATFPSHSPRRTPLWLRLLNQLAERQRLYSDAQRLSDLPDERLQDLNIPDEMRRSYAGRRVSAAEHTKVRITQSW